LSSESLPMVTGRGNSRMQRSGRGSALIPKGESELRRVALAADAEC
jgi:hypothetical protein